jgi:hypothetical protein
LCEKIKARRPARFFSLLGPVGATAPAGILKTPSPAFACSEFFTRSFADDGAAVIPTERNPL